MGRLKEYEGAIGGFTGGILSSLVCHPLELLKIRYSANEGSITRPQYSSYFDAVSKIHRAEGVRGLYQGLTPNLIGCAVSWGAYFHIYRMIRDWAIPRSSSLTSNPTASSAFINFASAYTAGALVMCVTNPIWVVKTRLCLQYESQSTGGAASKPAVKRYAGTIDCLRKILAEEGVRGLYKGFVPGVFGAVHGAVQMMVYAHLKDNRCAQLGLPMEAKLSTRDYLAYQVASKVIAVTGTYPYQVIRTRMQDHNAVYRGVWNTLKRTVQGEGIRGLYKGALMANIRTLPSTIIVFQTYETVRHII